jgi:diguanylate cyclase (GGDEF)-like protein
MAFSSDNLSNPPPSGERDSDGEADRYAQTNPGRSASASDARSSDSDQAAADSDQAASDADQTSSDTDQTASDEEQAASDQEAAAGSDQRVREMGSVQREHATHLRQEEAHARLRTGTARDITADERTQTAATRDRAAELRDLAATERDRTAKSSASIDPAGQRSHAEHDRKRAAADRASAAADRTKAARDRKRAAEERSQSARDRVVAAHDRAQAALDRQASEIDDLTHVQRRGAGIKQLQREIDRARRASEELVVAFIDVDGLKRVNDSEGHLAGDALLVAVADSLRACLRSYDLVMRFGGDEFVCALPHTSVEQTRRRFTEVSSILEAAPAHGSITVGFAQLADGDLPQDLIERADVDLLARRGPG